MDTTELSSGVLADLCNAPDESAGAGNDPKKASKGHKKHRRSADDEEDPYYGPEGTHKFVKMGVEAVCDLRLNSSEFRTLAALMIYADNKTGACFPSLKTIGKRIGISESQVSKNIGVLARYGYVLKMAKVSLGGRYKHNVYKVITNPKGYEGI